MTDPVESEEDKVISNNTWLVESNADRWQKKMDETRQIFIALNTMEKSKQLIVPSVPVVWS